MSKSSVWRPWPWLLAPLLAAALACSVSIGGTPSSQLILTQAAATASALAAPSAAPATATASQVPRRAATRAAADTPPGPTPTRPSSGPVALDPCSLMSQAEAEALLGARSAKPTVQNGACLFAEAQARVTVVNVYAYPPEQAQQVFQGHVFLLQGYRVKIDPAALDKLKADSAAGDVVASLNDLADMAVGQSNYRAEKVDGLGRAALWSWNAAGTVQQAYLLAAKPGAVAGLELVLSASSQEASTKQAVVEIVRRILAGLPESFTVAGVGPDATGTLTPAHSS